MIKVIVEFTLEGDEYTMLEHDEIHALLAKIVEQNKELKSYTLTEGYAE